LRVVVLIQKGTPIPAPGILINIPFSTLVTEPHLAAEGSFSWDHCFPKAGAFLVRTLGKYGYLPGDQQRQGSWISANPGVQGVSFSYRTISPVDRGHFLLSLGGTDSLHLDTTRETVGLPSGSGFSQVEGNPEATCRPSRIEGTAGSGPSKATTDRPSTAEARLAHPPST